jgi:hypothetical protein
VTAEPMSDFVLIASSTLIFVHVADREKFEAIESPMHDHGRRATGSGLRRRAAAKYLEEFGEPAPKGFERLRVHAVELQNLLEAVNRITKSRKSPAPTVLRLVA